MIRINKGLASIAAAGVLLVAACTTQSGPREGASNATAAPPKAAVISPAVLEAGRAVYKANCVACHGESGKGDGPGAGVLKPPPRDHTDRAYMSTLTDDDIKKVIQMGGAIKGKPLMPSSPQIKGEQLEALVAYIRSLSASNGN
jgi:mono/diheme cytochrome c family protein